MQVNLIVVSPLLFQQASRATFGAAVICGTKSCISKKSVVRHSLDVYGTDFFTLYGTRSPCSAICSATLMFAALRAFIRRQCDA
jgi:hypothetical protein